MTRHYDVRVSDRRPKAVIRHLLLHGIGPRNMEAKLARFESWWAHLDQHGFEYSAYVRWFRRQDWTLAEVLSYLEYQCLYLFGGIDERAFHDEWEIVKPVIDRLDITEWAVNVQPTVQPEVKDLAVVEL